MLLAFPQYLYGLLLLPPALLLALLARRERRYVVPCLRPWRVVLALPHPRPRRNPLDLETLCAVAGTLLLVLALAGPILNLPGTGERELVVIVDDSISMASRVPGRPSRLQQAEKWLERLGAKGFRITLYKSSSPAPLLVRAHADAATRTLGALRTAPQAPRERQAILAAALDRARSRQLAAVWISDTPPPVSSPRLARIRVGDPSRNLGLIKADISGEARHPRLFAAIANYGPRPAACRLLLSQAGGKHWIVPPAAAGASALNLPPGRIVGWSLALDTLAGCARSQPLRVSLVNADGHRPVRDDLEADNQTTLLAPRARSAAVDRKAFPRLALALEKAAGLRLLPPARMSHAMLAVVSATPAALPTTGLLLVAPRERSLGLVELGTPRRVEGVRLQPGPGGPPRVCCRGMGAFSLADARLPPVHRLLAWALPTGQEAPGAPARGLPLLATWQWRGRRVAYLGALPRAWTNHPAFPATVCALVERLLPARRSLPGALESDNRLHGEPTRSLPPLPGAGPRARHLPLARLCCLLAACAFALVFFCEWRRTSRRANVG